MLNKCLKVFNASAKGESVSFSELLEIISEYLTDIKFEKSNEMISFLMSNPNFIPTALSKVIEHFCRKYSIFRIFFNNKTILYYVSN